MSLNVEPAPAAQFPNTERLATTMDVLTAVGILVAMGCYAYRSGKRTGSRKGYHVGRISGRRPK